MPETIVTQRPPTEAEIKRWEAEARKFEAEARSHNAEAEGFEAEARLAKMITEREQYKRDIELVSNEHLGVYYFGSAVTESTAGACMGTLQRWTRLDESKGVSPRDIEIVFFSPGGSVVDGLALYDFISDIRARGHYITTSTVGMAASMAGILLQAGDWRVMARESSLLIHQVSFGASGSYGKVEDQVEWIKGLQDRVLDIFEARAKPINPKTTKAFLKRNWDRKDWWIAAPAAKRLGLVDEIREAPAPRVR